MRLNNYTSKSPNIPNIPKRNNIYFENENGNKNNCQALVLGKENQDKKISLKTIKSQDKSQPSRRSSRNNKRTKSSNSNLLSEKKLEREVARSVERGARVLDSGGGNLLGTSYTSTPQPTPRKAQVSIKKFFKSSLNKKQ